MQAALEINGIKRLYPKEIVDVENLLLFVLTHEIPNNELIVEVKLDGKVFSEVFKHQARELHLEALEKINIATLTKESFAKGFIEQAPQYLAGVRRGMLTAARLLKKPDNQEQGNEILARSLEVLRAFKCHYENVGGVLQNEKGLGSPTFSWQSMDSTANRIIALQERRDFPALANLLEKELVRFLDEWKEMLDRYNGEKDYPQ